MTFYQKLSNLLNYLKSILTLPIIIIKIYNYKMNNQDFIKDKIMYKIPKKN